MNQDPAPKVADIRYEVVNRFRHDLGAFTQGLIFNDGKLYESTGRTDRSLSTLRQVEIHTGNVLKRLELGSKYFAEGITLFQDRIIQLTLEGDIFIYSLKDFSLSTTVRQKRGGWGLTNDGQYLLMSNGSGQLQRINPATLQQVGAPINVLLNGKPLLRLNELEYINGSIYANVWTEDYVYRIDPKDGTVTGRIDLSALRPAETKDCLECVLNGIAWHYCSDHLFVTGKLWPTMFEIRLLP